MNSENPCSASPTERSKANNICSRPAHAGLAPGGCSNTFAAASSHLHFLLKKMKNNDKIFFGKDIMLRRLLSYNRHFHNCKTRMEETVMKSKKVLALFMALILVLGLAACGGSGSTEKAPAPAGDAEESEAVALDNEAFDALVASGPVADDAAIEANQWASKVKKAGVLRVGTTPTSFLFSQMDEKDENIRGFDAGLFQMLAKYILGDETKWEYTQVDSSTRESVLQNDQVDAVFATYSITPDRQKVISFAGPYYTSKQAVLVKAGNTDIGSVDDLAGKNVATQSGSTGPDILAEFAPEAVIQEFENDSEARMALEQGRVDAYVTDYTLLLNAIVKNPNKYEIAGDTFGPEDNYGIGLPLDSDGVAFVNDFLKQIVENGTWGELWKVSLGDRTGIDTVPEAPAIP